MQRNELFTTNKRGAAKTNYLGLYINDIGLLSLHHAWDSKKYSTTPHTVYKKSVENWNCTVFHNFKLVYLTQQQQPSLQRSWWPLNQWHYCAPVWTESGTATFTKKNKPQKHESTMKQLLQFCNIIYIGIFLKSHYLFWDNWNANKLTGEDNT